MSKIRQSERLLCRLLGPLLKVYLPLMTNVLKPLAKCDLMLLRLTAAASATDATIQNIITRLCMTTLLISNKEMGDSMEIVKSLKECSLLIKGVGETIKISISAFASLIFIGKYMHVFISSGFYWLLLLLHKISEKTKALCHRKIFLINIFDMWRLNVTVISVNPLYLIVNKINGHFEEINGNIYLTIAPTIEIKKIIKKYKVLWSKIK